MATLPQGTRFALQAWGFANGGNDEVTDEVDAVIMDVDSEVSEIAAMKEAGKVVLCYFTVGTLEPWREDTQGDARSSWEALGVGDLSEFDEVWLDVSRPEELQALMKPRFERAKSKGCDGIEPDVIDCHLNDECWKNLANADTQEEARAAQIAYDKWQVKTARELGLLIGLKNSVGDIDDLVDLYDFAVSESCLRYKSCDAYMAFAQQNKAVLHVEYSAAASTSCSSCTDGKSCETAAGAARPVMHTKYCRGSAGICTDAAWTECWVALDALNYTAFDDFEAASGGLSGGVVFLVVLLVAAVSAGGLVAYRRWGGGGSLRLP